jgi:hypothetical protein
MRTVLPMPNDLVPTSEAARILRRSPSQVARYADTGALPVAFRGPGERGALFFHRPDVDALAERIREADLAKWAEPAEKAS